MESLKQGFEDAAVLMEKLAEDLTQDWRSRLACDCPEQSAANRESIIRWLLGKDLLKRFEMLNPDHLEIAKLGMEYRYRILRHRYLGIGSEQAYRRLTTRLGSLVLLRNKICTWVAQSRNRSSAVVDVLLEVIHEILISDRYMQQQIAWIAECTEEKKMRNALLFASIEEYCLRPIRNQPLLVYRFVNYLRRTQRGGIVHLPSRMLLRLVSEDIVVEDSENPISLLDTQAIAQYQETQAVVEQQMLRTAVKQEFERYLAEQLGPIAVQWLQLYLQGYSQEAIADQLNLPVKEVYRLREKISYHAVRVFALKREPELVGNWLETCLQEHSFGLTLQQWQQLSQKLTPRQRQVCEQMKAGKNLEAIAVELKLKTHQVMGEWSKLYLAAQAVRSNSVK
jgi:DNA-binding NarL/FixJ family response regulator